MPVLAYVDGGVLLRVRVQPGARTEGLDGVREGVLRLRLVAPPVDGAANRACLAFFTRVLGVRRSQMTLRSGWKARYKVLRIEGITCRQAAAALGMPHSDAYA